MKEPSKPRRKSSSGSPASADAPSPRRVMPGAKKKASATREAPAETVAERRPTASAKKTSVSHDGSLLQRLSPRIVPATAEVIERRMDELRDAAAEAGTRALTPLLRRGAVTAFLAAVMEASPFLRDLMVAEPARLAAILSDAPEQRLASLSAMTETAWKDVSQSELMVALRKARQDVALTLGLADLGGVLPVVDVMAALTAFADAAVRATVNFLLSAAHDAGELELSKPADPATDCGWIILGMGKYGAGELNYSSDIDLIVLYDPAALRLNSEREPAMVFVRLTKRLVAILSEYTVDGYVFRTDLRLRPDPGTTNIALSTDAALQYYESLGQNWERAALIKARPVAGDIIAGERFLKELTPYIWRKYLDYAAIADIHAIKRQIHDHRGHENVAVAGHNVKLGRGGIREVEFFVQTQQLIAGGRNPLLRGKRTLDMLAAFADTGWIDGGVRDDLTRAYLFLRNVEHCIQMMRDEQTHTLPDDDDGLATIAGMMGFGSREAFGEALLLTLNTVRDRYSKLFEAAPSLTSSVGNLVFTGDSDDPDTLETLSRLGYRHPEDVTAAVRGWHFGRYPATRSTSARERLNDFVPMLIESLAGSDGPDTAFKAFDRFIARMPAGVQLFAILQSNPGLLHLLATILTTAPRLADTIIQRAHVLDALIEPAFFGSLPDKSVLEARLSSLLAEANSYEDILDRARIFGQEQQFLIGVRVLAGTVSVRNASHAYSDLADMLITALLDAVRHEFERAHGRIKGGTVALVALGRLGGREMTAESDLDLLLLYGASGTTDVSDGARPLPAPLYFARLTQRLVAALSSPTAEGTLYPVDLRLRPSGNAGPVATHIDAFVAYHAREAWTWEHMALTRARVVAGDAALVRRAQKEIAAVLKTPRKRKKTVADVLEMRAMVQEVKGGEGAWDIKQAAGGQVDIEFIAQALQLIHAAKAPDILATETEAALSSLSEAKLLARKEADVLLPALRLYASLVQLLRLCVDGVFDPTEAPRALLERLARAAELPDFGTLDAHLRDTEQAVRAVFERVLGAVPADGKTGSETR